MKDGRVRTITAEGELVGANPQRKRPKENPIEEAERLLGQKQRALARWNENHPDEPSAIWEAEVADAEATLAARKDGNPKAIVQTATDAWTRNQQRLDRTRPYVRPKAAPTTPSTDSEADDEPLPPGQHPASGPTVASVTEWANEMGRKYELKDVSDDLYTFAVTWLEAKPKPITFEFLADLRKQMDDGKQLSYPQAKGVLNCIVADGRRAARSPAPAPGRTPDASSATTGPGAGPDERPQRAALSPGIYRLATGGPGGKEAIFKVQAAVHGSNHLYAKRLIATEGGGNKGRFEFEKGAVSKLTPEDRLSLADAKKFGAIYGVCIVCGALLTDEDSIAAGIGPVCAGKV